MKYLTFFADHHDAAFVELGEMSTDVDALDIPATLRLDLRRWQNEYALLLPHGGELRPMAASRIAELDEVGWELAGRLAKALGEDSKVIYRSSGSDRDFPVQRYDENRHRAEPPEPQAGR